MISLRVPLRFQRIFRNPVWSGRRLAAVPGFRLPASARPETPPETSPETSPERTPEMSIGETWEIVDRPDDNSVVADGEFEGWTLRRLMQEARGDLLGNSSATADERFPLLVKLLDAEGRLSIQVHPDDERAGELRGAGLDRHAEAKTEAWYFLGESAGGDVLAGLRSGVTEAGLRERLGRGDPDLSDALVPHAAAPGTALLIRGGTLHAILEGVTLLEVQQNSDTTYRVHDHGRRNANGEPRELHVEQALACADFGRSAPEPVAPRWESLEGRSEAAHGAHLAERTALVQCEHFAMDALRLSAPAELETDGRYRIYCAARGTGAVEVTGTSWRLERLDTLLLPAATPLHRVVPDAEGLTLVRLDAGA